jgi:hypothetical protein
MQTTKLWILATAFGLAAVFGAPSARASSDYPEKLQQALGMPCAPPCSLCHLTDQGGPGMLAYDDKPFPHAMWDAGMRGALPDSLQAALDKLAMDTSGAPDSGAAMLDDLTAGKDPNTGGMADIACSDIRYGCGAHVAARPRFDGFALCAALAVLFGLGVLRRRRAARRTRPG